MHCYLEGNYKTYQIQQNDSLESLAKKFTTCVDQIRWDNSHIDDWESIDKHISKQILIQPGQEKILSVDIGGTHIKYAITSVIVHRSNFKYIKHYEICSENWLNERLIYLFDKNVPNSLASLIEDKYEEIYIGLPGEVSLNDFFLSDYYVNHRKMRSDIKYKWEFRTSKQVHIENDAKKWMKGALHLHKLLKQNICFPSLLITLGTGVGMGYTQDGITIDSYEVNRINCNKLAEVSWEFTPWKDNCAHQFLGKNFSQCIKQSSLNVNQEYTKRVIAFLQDTFCHFQPEINFKSIFIGGGEANHLDDLSLEKKFPEKQIILLNEKSLEQFGISAKIIPLISHSFG